MVYNLIILSPELLQLLLTNLREVSTEASSSRAFCLAGRQGQVIGGVGGVGGVGGDGGDGVEGGDSRGGHLVARPLSCGR